MILLAAIALGLALVPLSGGTFRRLGRAPFHAPVLLPIALALQTLPSVALRVTDVARAEALTVVCWTAGAAVLLLVCWRNWHLHGIRIVALGVACNAVVILLNRGMPVGMDALRLLGDVEGALRFLSESPLYQLESELTRLLVLADVMPLPGPPSVRAVVSLGDLLLFSGVLVSIVQSGSTRLADV